MKYLYRTLDKVKKLVNEKDYDFVIVVAGKGNRVGKSTLGLDISDYIEDNQFSIDRVVFSEADIYRIWKKLTRGQVMNIDAAEQILLSQDTMTKSSKAFVKNMISAAAKNNVYIITLSNFFKLNNFIKLEKVDLLIYVYKRGHFWVYGKKQMANLILKYNQLHNKKVFRMPNSDLEDTFEPRNDTLWMEYYKRKMENIDKSLDKRSEQIMVEDNESLGIYDTAKQLDMTEKEVMDLIWADRIRAEQLETGWRISFAEILRVKEELKKKTIVIEKKKLPKDEWNEEKIENVIV